MNDMNNSDKLSALIHSAVAGDTSTLPQVKELLASLPELVPAIGDAQRQVEQKILDMTIGQNILKREAITRDLDFHERQLRDDPTYVEQLVIRQIRADLLMLASVQQRALERRDTHTDKLLNSAHRRFLASLKCLEQLRKFSPALHINIAENQVNLS